MYVYMSKYLDDKALFLEPQVTQYGNHMVMTNVTKGRKLRYINIDTRFGDGVDPDGAIQFTIPERIIEVTSIRVKQAEIPVSFYNISAELGNHLFHVRTTDAEAPIPLQLPDGQYTLPLLVDALNVLLEPYHMNVAVSEQNPVCQIAHQGTTTHCVLYWNMHDRVIQQQLGWMLGFRSPATVLKMGETKTSEAFVNIHPLRYLFLVMDEFNNHAKHSFVSPTIRSMLPHNILCRIQLSKEFGTIMRCNIDNLVSDRRMYQGTCVLQKLKFQLVNEWGAPVHLHGLDYSFLLEVECQ